MKVTISLVSAITAETLVSSARSFRAAGNDQQAQACLVKAEQKLRTVRANSAIAPLVRVLKGEIDLLSL